MLHLLLVENDPILRRVASGFLTSLGHNVKAADNSQEALGESFFAWDCVLLDCVMPELNGFEVASRWRQREQAENLARTPIIGLISNDEERTLCLQAGMDDSLKMPFSLEALREMLNRRANEPSHVQQSWAIEQRTCLLEDYEGFHELLVDMVRTFLAEYSLSVAELRAAFEHKDITRLQASAHKFKGSALMMHAKAAVSAAKDIENCARAGTLELVPPLLDALVEAEQPQRMCLETLLREISVKSS